MTDDVHRIISQAERLNETDKRLSSHEQRLSELETMVHRHEDKVKEQEGRFVWRRKQWKGDTDHFGMPELLFPEPAFREPLRREPLLPSPKAKAKADPQPQPQPQAEPSRNNAFERSVNKSLNFMLRVIILGVVFVGIRRLLLGIDGS